MLMSFGFGDGGGGPTREMLENIREMGEFPGTPQVKNGRPSTFSASWRPNRAAACPPGTANCTWNTTVAPTPPRPHQARQPQERVSAARRRIFGDAGPALATDYTYPAGAN
jgi:hypothetical protein